MACNINSVQQLITCIICHEHFADPRVLPCSHTYCHKCIDKMASTNRDQFECPLRDGTLVVKNDIGALPLNQGASDLVELYSKLIVSFYSFSKDRYRKMVFVKPIVVYLNNRPREINVLIIFLEVFNKRMLQYMNNLFFL